LAIPFVLCEALEDDVHVLRLIDESWTAVERVKDIDIPSSIRDIKDGEISAFKVCYQVQKELIFVLVVTLYRRAAWPSQRSQTQVRNEKQVYEESTIKSPLSISFQSSRFGRTPLNTRSDFSAS
jgi:hypothetical protein